MKINRHAKNVKNDFRFFMPEEILSKWHPEIHAAQSDDASTINIYDIVGEDWWTGEGMTAKIVSKVLRNNVGKEITVNINSPGGDFFEGLAIYNLLKEHDGGVVVRIVGMAASAASIIAMAGDQIKIAEAGYIMIHNAWNVCVGNRHEMADMSNTLEQFDATMASLYAKKTGLSIADISAMMDSETWISGKDSVEKGFATQFLDSDELDVEDKAKSSYSTALKEVDVALAKAGKSRSERRSLIKNLTSTPGAAVNHETTPRASEENEGDIDNSVLSSFINTLNSK